MANLAQPSLARPTGKKKSKKKGAPRAKMPRPYFRKFDGWWYVESPEFVPLYGKKAVKLAKGIENESAAWTKYEEIMSGFDAHKVTASLPPEKQRIDALANDYLAWHSEKGNSDTRSGIVNRAVKSFCQLCGANTVEEFEAVAFPTMDRWVKANKGWASSSSKRYNVKAIIALFNWARKYRKLNRNPLAGYPIPEEVARVTIFTTEEEKALLEASCPAFRQYLTARIKTGGRPGEVAKVTAKHVMTDESGKPVAWDLGLDNKSGKKGKHRVIYLPPDMSALTAELMKKHPTGPLFRNAYGRKFGASGASKYFRELRPKANLSEDHVLYSARHTFIVRALISTGGDVALVAELAGNTMAVIRSRASAVRYSSCRFDAHRAQRGRLTETVCLASPAFHAPL